jgi:hypothetical protein
LNGLAIKSSTPSLKPSITVKSSLLGQKRNDNRNSRIFFAVSSYFLSWFIRYHYQ